MTNDDIIDNITTFILIFCLFVLLVLGILLNIKINRIEQLVFQNIKLTEQISQYEREEIKQKMKFNGTLYMYKGEDDYFYFVDKKKRLCKIR